MQNIGKEIREARKKQGMSSKELAEKVGVNERLVRYWETGERQLSLENADKILKALGVSLTIGKEN